MTPVPMNWPRVKLGEACELQNGFAFEASRFARERGFPLIRIRDLKTGVPSECFDGEFSSGYVVQPGDLLVGMDGEFRCYRWQGPPALLNQRVCRLIPKSHFLDADFLLLSLNRHLKQIEEQTGFTTVKHISSGQILAIELPLPPLQEQRRIAARLTEQLAAVERARRAAEARVEAARALPSSTLRRFGSQVTSLPRRKLGDVADMLPSVSVSSDGDAAVQCVTTACLSELGFRREGLKASTMWAGKVDTATLTPGEILVARSNTAGLVGRVAMYDGSAPGAVSSDLTIRLRSRDSIRAEFLAGYLSFLFVDGYWRDRAGGASGSMKKITRSQLAMLPVPAPSLEEQDLACSDLRNWRGQADAVARMINVELAAIEALPAALLREAFEDGA